MAPYSRLAVAALAALAVVLMAGGPRGCNGQAPAKAPAAPKPAANKPAPPPKPSPAASIMPAFGIQPVQFDDEVRDGGTGRDATTDC